MIPVVESMGKGLMGTPLVSTVLAAELIRRAGGIAEEDVLEDISGGCAATVAYLDGSDWGGANTGVSVDANGVLSGSKFMVPDAAQATWIAVVGSDAAGDAVVALVAGSDVAAQAQASHALIDLTNVLRHSTLPESKRSVCCQVTRWPRPSEITCSLARC